MLLLSMAATFMLTDCSGSGDAGGNADSAEAPGKLPDTLHVVTLNSPRSYFLYRDQPMGYDYSLIEEFARKKGMVLDLQVANSFNRAMEMVNSGRADVFAYDVPVTSEFKRRIVPAGPANYTNQVLVQRNGEQPVTDVADLIGKDIYVLPKSKYYYRLKNLNEELGGGINIHTIDNDSIIIDDVLRMVQRGEIPMTVVDSDIAQLNKTYYPDLDIGLDLSFRQKSQWAVNPRMKWLADSIDSFFGTDLEREKTQDIYRQYYEVSKRLPGGGDYAMGPDRISKYDHYFKKYAKDIGWDWRMLASQGYVESRFNPNARSWAGAVGLMQVMPSTARPHGANARQLRNPETSVRVAVKVLEKTDRIMSQYVKDPEERKKFDIAAYNSGAAHVIDAIRLAKKYGLDPTKWEGNVEKAILMKQNPRYYKDPVVKYGYSRGRETAAYVRQVTRFYERAKRSVTA